MAMSQDPELAADAEPDDEPPGILEGARGFSGVPK
jgi:hypothetical protein